MPYVVISPDCQWVHATYEETQFENVQAVPVPEGNWVCVPITSHLTLYKIDELWTLHLEPQQNDRALIWAECRGCGAPTDQRVGDPCWEYDDEEVALWVVGDAENHASVCAAIDRMFPA